MFPKSSDSALEKNVIRARGTTVLENPDAFVTLRNNMLFSAGGKVQCRKLKNYSQTGSYSFEADWGNLLADPLLVEFEAGRVNFAADSPGLKLGIKPIVFNICACIDGILPSISDFLFAETPNWEKMDSRFRGNDSVAQELIPTGIKRIDVSGAGPAVAEKVSS